jgi:hypothetical protein
MLSGKKLKYWNAKIYNTFFLWMFFEIIVVNFIGIASSEFVAIFFHPKEKSVP